MCETVEQARAHVLALLNRGNSPEEVEAMLEGTLGCVLEPSALTDPLNDPQFKEVTDHGSAEGAG